MIATETLHFKRLARIRELALSCKDQLPEAAEQYTVNLNATVDRLAELVGVQGSMEARARELKRVREQARTALRADLSAIGLAATAIALDVPGFDDKFRTPPAGDQKLVAAARTFAADAVAFADSLTRYALPANFIEDLKNHLQVFEKAHLDYGIVARERRAGRAVIEKAMREANDATIHLDAVVRNTFRNDSANLSQWEKATKFGWSKRKKSDKSVESPAQASSPPVNNTAAA